MPYKPAGWSSVSPYLIVEGAAATIEFLQQVFGATLLRSFAGDDGTVRHSEVRIEDSVLMVADGQEGWPARPAHVHVYVRDVDAAFARALAAGATSVQAPAKKDDADRRSGVTDPGGTTWWIATKVE
ncbi:MAG: VOC family protein [Thermoanaerobaculia bacterium]